MRQVCFVIAALLSLLVASSAGASEQILRRGNGLEPDTLDPHKSTLEVEGIIIRDFLHGLVKRNGSGELVPACATSWAVSQDGLTWTFTLRDNLLWSDGIPVVAADFVAGVRRLFDPSTAAINATLLYVIQNSRAAASGKVALADIGVEALDDKTVIFHLEHPEPNLLSSLATRISAPVPRHLVAEHGESFTSAGTALSNGPFRLVSWSAHEAVHLVRNSLYYDAKNVKIDR